MANIPQRGRPAPFTFPGSGPFMRRASYYAGPPAAPAPRSCCQACAVGQPCGTKLGDPWTPGPSSPVGPIVAYPIDETVRNLIASGTTMGPVQICSYAKDPGNAGVIVLQCFDQKGAAGTVTKTCWNVSDPDTPPQPMDCFEDL